MDFDGNAIQAYRKINTDACIGVGAGFVLATTT
jgi:hypothetical protein